MSTARILTTTRECSPSRCQGKGMQTRIKVKNEKAEKKLVVSDMVKRAMPDAFLQTTRGESGGESRLFPDDLGTFCSCRLCAL